MIELLIKSGVDSVWCAVADAERALSFYRDYASFEVVSDEILPADKAGELFRVSHVAQVRLVTVDGGLRKTRLRLVEFKPGSGRSIRANTLPWDIGFYCITYQVQDLEKLSEDLGAKGFSFVAPTHRYSGFAPWEVSERTLLDPEGTAINHFQRHSNEKYLTGRNYVQLDHCGLQVSSIAEVQRFFGTIGLHCVAAGAEVPPGIIDNVINLPAGHRIRVAGWGAEDKATASLEILEITPPGRLVVGRPPDTGFFMISFKVDALSPVLSAIQSSGFPVFSGPVRNGLPGTTACAVVEGPSGILTMFEEN
jgi:catechol 2,3-dioxygenase-like lactoylglutathione lyase family enzyme